MSYLSEKFHPVNYKENCYLFNPEFATVMMIDPIIQEIVTMSDEELKNISNYSSDHQMAYEELQSLITQIDEHAITGPEVKCPQPVKSLDLHIAHVCNLRCRYCYGEGGHYGGQETMMDHEVARDSVDFLIKNSRDEKKITLTFFGGEPMLNFDLIKETAIYAEEQAVKHGKEIKFSVLTNGTVGLDEQMSFMKEHNFSIQVTIDGPEEYQDDLRPMPGKKSSFAEVQKIVPKMLEADLRPVARSIVTRKNMDLMRIYNAMIELGFADVSFGYVTSKDSEIMLAPEDLPVLFDSLEGMAEETFQNLITGKRPPGVFMNVLSSLLNRKRNQKQYNCSIGKWKFAVAPDGKIFVCHRFVNVDEFYMGHVHEGCYNTELQQKFYDIRVDQRKACQKCWVRNYCGGSCLHNNYTYTGNLEVCDAVHCNIVKKIFEEGVKIYIRLQQEAPEVLKKIASLKSK